jgi:hypothetical protein
LPAGGRICAVILRETAVKGRIFWKFRFRARPLSAVAVTPNARANEERGRPYERNTEIAD